MKFNLGSVPQRSHADSEIQGAILDSHLGDRRTYFHLSRSQNEDRVGEGDMTCWVPLGTHA